MKSRTSYKIAAATVLGLALAACSADEVSNTEQRTQAFYSVDQARILGFEEPQDDWVGALKTESVTTQGSAAARVSASGGFVLTTSLRSERLGQRRKHSFD